ncbi:MAG: BF3164 family lipoprotein [Flavobacteriales bacterium]|nr:BF3164 family lipoprotein [Flavobacteriales bacterium]
MKHILVFSVFASMFCISCSSTEKGTDGFPPAENITADSIAINEIIEPSSFSCVDNYMVIAANSKDSLVYVYSLPEMKYLYSALKVGEGPGEYPNQWIYVEPNLIDGKIAINDYRLDAFNLYKVTDTAIVHTDVIFTDTASRPKDAKVYSLKSPMFGSDFHDKDLTVYLSLQNLNTAERTDTIASYAFLLRQDLPGGGSMTAGTNYPDMLIHGNDLAVIYSQTDRREFYDISKGKFDLVKMSGDKRPISQLKEEIRDAENGIDVKAVQDEKYIYVFENTVKTESAGVMSKIPQVKQSRLLVYDHKGNPVKKYLLDHIVDTSAAYNGKAYCYNSKEDFTQIYVYDLGL